jgi:hypothetical protein
VPDPAAARDGALGLARKRFREHTKQAGILADAAQDAGQVEDARTALEDAGSCLDEIERLLGESDDG